VNNGFFALIFKTRSFKYCILDEAYILQKHLDENFKKKEEK